MSRLTRSIVFAAFFRVERRICPNLLDVVVLVVQRSLTAYVSVLFLHLLYSS